MANTKSTSNASKNKKTAAKAVKPAPAEELVKEEKVLEEAAAASAAPEAPAPEAAPVAAPEEAAAEVKAEEQPAAPIEVVTPETEAPAEEPAPEVKVEEKKKILFVASEAAPFIATGGLAEVIGSLSKALAKEDRYDVRVIVPLYQDIKKEYRKDFRFIGNIFVPLSWRNQYCGIFEYVKDNVTFYFVDNEYYFKRPGCYGYYDDGERFAFFCRSVMEILSFLNFYPDILHCHDWQAALAAIYLKTIYCFRPEYQFIRAVFTIHNIEYQGQYSLDILEDLFGISYRYQYLVEYDRCINLMKGAIECCEQFTTVSPTYAGEIKDPYYSHGLDPIVRRQRMLNLPVKPETPIIAMITRLVSHKGLDLVKEVIEQALRQDIQFVLLGTGDSMYENYFSDLARRYQGKVVSIISFNSDLSRKIYSGADIFLMPSKSEPCGLSQMIASRYGTVAIVRETGGLRDSISPYGAGGNGFTFHDYNAYDMLYVINEAIGVYHNKDEWKRLMHKAMTTDFTWAKSAKYYEGLYLGMLMH